MNEVWDDQQLDENRDWAKTVLWKLAKPRPDWNWNHPAKSFLMSEKPRLYKVLGALHEEATALDGHDCIKSLAQWLREYILLDQSEKERSLNGDLAILEGENKKLKEMIRALESASPAGQAGD